MKCLSVQDLIDTLSTVEDKSQPVLLLLADQRQESVEALKQARNISGLLQLAELDEDADGKYIALFSDGQQDVNDL